MIGSFSTVRTMMRTVRSTLAVAPLLVSFSTIPCWAGETDGVAETATAVRLLIDEGFYPQAETAACSLLSSAEASDGQTSTTAAAARDLLVEALIANGKVRDPATRRLAESALARRTDLHGAESLDLVPSLTNLGVILKEIQDFPGAEEALTSGYSIRKSALGPDHPYVASSLNQLASLSLRQRQADSALELYERALAIVEASGEPESAEVSICLNGIGSVKVSQGGTAESEPLFERSLALREQSLGQEHPLVAESLRSLAVTKRRLGKYDEAVALLRRALSIQELRLRPDHLKIGGTLNSLATTVRLQGDYVEARMLYERALAIMETSLEADDPYISGVLNNLANVHKLMGDFSVAQLYLERALRIREHRFGPDHPAVAQSLTNLAAVLVQAGWPAGAVPLLRRAVKIKESAYGSDSVDFAVSLVILGVALNDTGELEEAEEVLENAVSIRELVKGRNQHKVAEARNNLALVWHRQGRLEEAQSGFEGALEIMSSASLPDHPIVVRILNNFARVTADRGEIDTAVALALRAEKQGREILKLTARGLSEREALSFAEYLRTQRNLLFNLATRCTDCRSDVWDSLIQSRGQVIHELAERRRAADTTDPEIAEMLAELKSAAENLAKLNVRGPGKALQEDYAKRLSAARGHVEELERSLGRVSSAFRRDQLRSQIGFVQVMAALPPSASLVGVVRSAFFSESVDTFDPTIPAYLAFVHTPGQQVPRVVSLGEAAVVDDLVEKWQAATVANNKLSEADSRRAGDALRRHIWDPLSPLLARSKTVFIVPDGLLNLVNFAALPVAEDEYLVEHDPMIHMLSEERDLVPLNDALSLADAPQLLAVGDPDFDLMASGETTPTQPSAAHSGARGTASPCSNLDGVLFQRLPTTADETRQIVALWNQRDEDGEDTAASAGRERTTTRLIGPEATEARFKELAPGKTVLHLATHGFALDGRCRSGPSSGRGIGGLTASQVKKPEIRAPQGNPLQLAGLALAGANHRNAAAPNEEDGVLTATEIVNLDLSRVEWAVLSACDSGIGESISGEGVSGFRRAFRIAGARTTIMSLWPVDDAAGLEWMEALYRGRLVHAMSTAEAVRHASLQSLRNRRARGESTHPFYWGAFVASGDWR